MYQLSQALLAVTAVFCALAETVSIATASIKKSFFIFLLTFC
jgi:hypothetical protein